MAGELYIESISSDDVENLVRLGGSLIESVFHSDKSDMAVLQTRAALAAGAQNRRDLPAHCYIRFERNNTTQTDVLRMSRILDLTSRPPVIVSTRAAFAGWAGLTDLQKAQLLWAELANAAVTLEFYKVGFSSVKTHYPKFTMVPQ
ncbi:hypothetical protein [Pseudomonas putida]|uniref:Uncharacterized protein n=1 Tax=Pseudomonas putida TaxID=303 RepID=A0A1Q9R4M8_PSEPU|nr:hypothetical protein [Pseudomonas putida]OLS62359.1 hypothetical protein PSEMO_26570 [Pseudomonas putida]